MAEEPRASSSRGRLDEEANRLNEESGSEEDREDDNEVKIHDENTTDKILVKFPYQENESQKEMREKILEGLQKRKHCLLESPTGTGKTATLLCATLGWQQHVLHGIGSNSFIPNAPKKADDVGMASPSRKKLKLETPAGQYPRPIYYCTRTHTQIAQAIKELKNTSYRTSKMTILASREQTCISDLVEKEKERRARLTPEEQQRQPPLSKRDICKKSRQHFYATPTQKRNAAKICEFYQPKRTENFFKFQDQGAWDIEDLKKQGKSCKECPYYGSLEMQKKADIIFCTYDSLLDPAVREKSGTELKNAVVIFDEAHNLEDACRRVFAFTLDPNKWDMLIRQCIDKHLPKAEQNQGNVNNRNIKMHPLNVVSATLKNWSLFVKDKKQTNYYNREPEVHKGEVLSDILRKMTMTVNEVDVCLEAIEEFKLLHPHTLSSKIVEVLEGVGRILRFLFQTEQGRIGDIGDFVGAFSWTDWEQKEGFKFEIICLNPAIAFKAIERDAYCIIAASATLKPFESFMGELATDFPIRHEGGHIVHPRNVWAGIVPRGPKTNALLELNNGLQSDEKIHDEIGQIIYEICTIVPNGVLVLVPSYGYMNRLKERWEEFPVENSVLNKIRNRMKVFFEERGDKQKVKLDLKEFFEASETETGSAYRGAVFFAVFRGNLSEGINFANKKGRAVITIGMPYIKAFEPFVSCKQSYNEQKNKSNSNPPKSGGNKLQENWDWYEIQAIRAVNHGLGRCIRHRDDWAALILIDIRWNKHSDRKEKLPGWVKQALPSNDDKDFPELMTSLAGFVNRMKLQENGEQQQSEEHGQ